MYPQRLDDVGGDEFDPPRPAQDADEADAQGRFEDPDNCDDQVFGNRIKRLVCTRPSEHGGDHVACDEAGQVCARWPVTRLEADDECPNCQCGTLEDRGDELVCRGECGHIFPKSRSSVARHRVVPKVCRRCGATSAGGVYCPNGCGRV
jgi:hypothetical protein